MKRTKQIAFCGLLSAVCIVLMTMSGLIPFATYAIPALAGMLTVAVISEAGWRWSIATYVVCTAVSLLMPVNLEASVMFAVFFGYYPTLWYVLSGLKSKVLRLVIGLAVFNAAMIGTYAVIANLIGLEALLAGLEMIGTVPALLLFLLLGNITFLIYDRAVKLCFMLYNTRFKGKLIKL